MEKKDPIEEARRYVSNAKETIEKANFDPEIRGYTDNKYVVEPQKDLPRDR